VADLATLPSQRDPGLVCTFYSYKGGVGRSMALANIAALLARLGKRVLVIDWDLEAPGLERYFGDRLQGSRRSTDGLIDITDAFARGERLDWRRCLLQAALPQATPIDVLHAGREGESYAERLRAVSWESLFEKKFGNFLDEMRSEWIAEYDYVLIDSRTGITDIGGICTIFMPDFLVTLFTTNSQSVQGVRDTMARARDRQSELPLKRRRMVIIPIAARDESATEYRRAAEWRARAAAALDEFYSDWIHKDETAESVLDYLKIPYVAYWSFGEQLPVIEEDPQNPKNLAYSYSLIARLIHTRLDWTEVREGRKTTEQQQVRDAEVQVKLADAAQARADAQARALEDEKAELRRREEIVLLRCRSLVEVEKSRGLIYSALALVFGGGAVAALWWLVRQYNELAVPMFTFGMAVTAMIAFVGTALAGGSAVLSGGYARRRAALERERALYEIRAEPSYVEGPRSALLTFASRIEAIAAGSSEGKAEPANAASPAGATGPPGPSPDVAMSSPPAPTTTRPSPPVVTVDTGPVDVFVDYADAGIVRDWTKEFIPLLRTWLSEAAGRDIRMVESSQMPPGADGRDWATEQMSRATLIVAIATSRYLASTARIEAVRQVVEQRPRGSLVVVTLDRSAMDQAPGWLREITWSNFSDLAYIGEGFTKSERYVEFQDRIRSLATTMADQLRSPSAPLRK
jgi:MinD-like ATPase involved in chromosome partitioning or flagellar assembly